MALDSMRKEERVYEELTQAVCEALDLDFGVFEHTMAEILPMNQHNYTLTRSQIEEKRQQWLLDHTDQGRKQDHELTREFVLNMFYEQ